MIYSLYARCAVDCDDGRRAMSLSASYRLHKKNDEQDLSLHKQNMVVLSICPFLKRMQQHFLQTLSLGHAYIAWMLISLCHFVCSVFLRLGIAFLFVGLLCQKVFFCTEKDMHIDKTSIDLNDHLSFGNVLENHLWIWFRDTTCRSLLTCKSPYVGDGV